MKQAILILYLFLSLSGLCQTNGYVLQNADGSNSLASGSITNAQLAGSITYSKLSLTGSILNADLAGSIDAAKINTGAVSNTEFNYLDGVTSAIQTQMDLKAALASPTFTGTVVLPNSTVTNAMLAGSIAYSKLSLTGAILNADLAGSIAYSKLSLTSSILNADLAGSIAYSKLSLTGAILNGDLAGSIANAKLANSTISGVPLGSNLGTLTFDTHITGTSYNGSAGVTIGVDATTTSTVSVLVARDGSANVYADNFVPSLNSTATGAATTTLTVDDKAIQQFTGSTTQTVKLPAVSTLTTGHTYEIDNLSTGLVTVQSSGSNTIVILAANTWATFTCISTSGTGTASWTYSYGGVTTASGKVLTVNNNITLTGTDGEAINVTTPTAGKILIGDGTNMVLSANTFPNASATSLKWLRSDGTNWIASTSTLSDAPSTAGKILVSDGTNWITSTPTFPNSSATSRKIIVSDGTNWTASTELWPIGTGTGNTLISDGTNWVSQNTRENWTTFVVSGSNATTTGQSLVDVTGLLSGTLSNSTLYEVEAWLNVTTSSVTTGTEYGIGAGGTGGAAVVQAMLIGNSTGTTITTENIVASATATSARLLTSAQSGMMYIHGWVTTRGSGTATISIQHLKVTSGTSTVLIGSKMKIRLANGFGLIYILLALLVALILTLSEKLFNSKTNNMKKTIIALLTIIALTGTANAQISSTPKIIFVNGKDSVTVADTVMFITWQHLQEFDKSLRSKLTVDEYSKFQPMLQDLINEAAKEYVTRRKPVLVGTGK